MNLMEKLESFLTNKDLINLFKVKGYQPLVIDNWFYLKNLKTNKTEKMSVYQDQKDPKRIRFKGEKWAFSLNRNQEGALYLDHLLIGDVKKEEFIFSMRHKYTVIDGNNGLVDENINIKLASHNMKHIFHIRKNALDIEQISVLPKNYTNPSYYQNVHPQYQLKHYHFYQDETDTIELLKPSLEKAQECIKEFIYLEDFYPTITSYMSKDFKIIDEAMKKCHDIRRNNTKIYVMKRNKK